MNPLDFIPKTALLIAAVAAGGTAIYQELRLRDLRAELGEQGQTLANERATSAKTAAATALELKADNDRRLTLILEANNANEKASRQRVADAERSRTAERRLRDQLATQLLTDRGETEPTAALAACRQTGEATAQLFGRCIGRYRDLAQRADESYAAGQFCERSYDSVSPPATLP